MTMPGIYSYQELYNHSFENGLQAGLSTCSNLAASGLLWLFSTKPWLAQWVYSSCVRYSKSCHFGAMVRAMDDYLGIAGLDGGWTCINILFYLLQHQTVHSTSETVWLSPVGATGFA
jgi:hypothetical protein